MLYQPTADRLWDTWIVRNGDLYHLFYIRISDGHAGLWNGVSLATSTDLIHWREVGPVLEKSAEAAWLGTGMIIHAGGRWLMNYSEEIDHRQVIRFAESDDLRKWRKLEADFPQDPRWYESNPAQSAETAPRWDSLGIVHLPERRGAPWLGVFTANARDARRGASGVLGLAESDDGLHWRALPPACAPGLMTHFEVPEIVSFGGRWYATFATNTVGGTRFDERANGNSGGTYYLVADQPEGPYVLPATDPLLQGTRGDRNVFALMVGRMLDDGAGGHLFYHQWGTPRRGPNGRVGPVKRLIEVAPWQLALVWWEGNEGLRGARLASGAAGVEADPPIGALPVVRWTAADDDVIVEDEGGCGAATWTIPDGGSGVLGSGRILETGVRIARGHLLGVWIGTEPTDAVEVRPMGSLAPNPDDCRLAIGLNAARGQVEFLRLMRGIGASLVVQECLAAIPWPVVRGVTHRLRVLWRGDCLEAYVDDRWVHGLVIPEGLSHRRLGLVSDRANGLLAGPEIWAMA